MGQGSSTTITPIYKKKGGKIVKDTNLNDFIDSYTKFSDKIDNGTIDYKKLESEYIQRIKDFRHLISNIKKDIQKKGKATQKQLAEIKKLENLIKIHKEVLTEYYKVKGGIIGPGELLQRAIDFTFSGPRKFASAPFRKFLEENGNKDIAQIQIFRTPIFSVIDKVLNVISVGYWNLIKNKLAYDNLFHLYLVITLANGQQWRLEKNHIVEAKRESNKHDGLNVPIHRVITVNELIKNGEQLQGQDKFWHYRADTQNCQVFCYTLLKGSDLITQEAEDFILQDTETVISALPSFTQKIINKTTDFASSADILINGRAIKRKKKIRRRIR